MPVNFVMNWVVWNKRIVVFFFCAILLALIESNLLCYVFLAETTATCKEDKKLEKHSALIGFCIVSIVFFFLADSYVLLSERT